MLPTRLLVRTACRLQNFWRSRAQLADREDGLHLERLHKRMQFLQRAMAWLDKARAANLVMSVPCLRLTLLDHFENVRQALDTARNATAKPPAAVPSLASFLAELRQIDADFDDCRIDLRGKVLSAVTEPITLKDVYLGPFAVRFHWERILGHVDATCFDIVAIDPQPAAANNQVIHPHVREPKLCPGEAAAPLRLALEEGRLADAFCLVRSVLNHYNPASAHVCLDEWIGTDCHDCGRTVAEDDRCSCDGCNRDFCDDCIHYCSHCSGYRCSDCMSRCAVCAERYCGRCLTTCAVSGQECCPGCTGHCPRCRRMVARDELDGEGICTSCAPSPLEPSETLHDSGPEPDTFAVP